MDYSELQKDKYLQEFQMVIPTSGIQKPSGWRLLVYPFKPPTKTAGGIIKPQSRIEVEEDTTMAAFVLQVGEEAYADKNRFKAMWVKPGQWVLLSRHAGVRVKIESGTPGEHTVLRVINDDEVIAILDNPSIVVKK